MTGSRVAVIADVHGVLPALDAVLAEPDVIAAERIVALGDIAAGPEPGAVLDRLMALGDRVTWIMGNADREMVELRRGARATIADPIGLWTARQLSDEHLARLANQRPAATIAVAGLGRLLFCHATPTSDEDVVLVDAGPARWRSCSDLYRPTSTASYAATPTCRSCGSRWGGWWSTPAASGCRMAGSARTGRCWVRGSTCGAPCWTPRPPAWR